MALLNIFTGASNRALGFSNAEPPSAPTFSTTKTATSITVTYTLNSGAFPIQTTQYKLGSGAYTTVTGGSFTLTGLSVNTSYTITMRSTDLAEQTSLESSSVTTTNTETAPSAPASVTASSSSSTTLSINFTAATAGTYPIASYQYVLYTGGSPVGDWATTPTGPGETFIRSGLTPDATYTVYVRAIASVTTTPSSNRVATAQVNPGTPGQPTLSWASTDASNRSSASFSWNATPYATSYILYNWATSTYLYPTAGATSYTAAGLSAGTTYWFSVLAYNRIGENSGWSPARYITTGQTNVAYVQRNNSIRYVADPTFNYGGDTYNADVVSTVTLPTIPTNDPNTAGYIYINSMGATFAWMQAPGIAGNPSYTTSKYSAIYSFAGSSRTTAWKTDATLSGNGWGSGFNTTNINGTNAINKALGDNYFCYISTGGTALSGKRFSVAALGAGWSSLSSAPDPNDATQSYGTLIGYNAGSFETVYAYALIMSSLYVEGYQTTATTYA